MFIYRVSNDAMTPEGRVTALPSPHAARGTAGRSHLVRRPESVRVVPGVLRGPFVHRMTLQQVMVRQLPDLGRTDIQPGHGKSHTPSPVTASLIHADVQQKHT